MMRCTSIACGLLAAVLPAQDARVQTVEVRDHVYMLMGQGGNIGLSVGEDGAFLIDDQFAPMVGQIKAAVAKLTDREVQFLVNTHFHGDHTGGNERFGAGGTVIVAHQNVRKRMSTEQFSKTFQRTTPPQPKAALPVVTFTRDVTLHWNGDEVEVFHVEHAHTDGDAIVWFKRANVLHMGDTFFNGSYPYIDVDAGGSLSGLVRAADRVLEIADGETKIIPGHGPLGDRAALEAYRGVLAAVRERVSALVAEGKTLEEVRAANPIAEWDADWGQGFMKPEMWLGIVYRSVVAEQEGGDK